MKKQDDKTNELMLALCKQAHWKFYAEPEGRHPDADGIPSTWRTKFWHAFENGILWAVSIKFEAFPKAEAKITCYGDTLQKTLSDLLEEITRCRVDIFEDRIEIVSPTRKNEQRLAILVNDKYWEEANRGTFKWPKHFSKEKKA